MKQLAYGAALAMLACPVLADDALTISDLGKHAELTAAFDKMAEGHTIPDWVRGGAVGSPAEMAAFDGREYLVFSGCKQHDCGANQVALLYDPKGGVMYGLLVEGNPEKAQSLTWLNIGGNAESIDGRTVLFAATTGSLANHPDAFDYR